jgi:hypothetical protein
VPKSEHDRIRFNYWSALTDATSVKDDKLRLQVVISELEHGGYDAAARCLGEDLDAVVVHLRYPLRHRERWRSTNLLERSLGGGPPVHEGNGRFPGETSCLSLVWAVLDLFFSHASNGVTFKGAEDARPVPRRQARRVSTPMGEPFDAAFHRWRLANKGESGTRKPVWAVRSIEGFESLALRFRRPNRPCADVIPSLRPGDVGARRLPRPVARTRTVRPS